MPSQCQPTLKYDLQPTKEANFYVETTQTHIEYILKSQPMKSQLEGKY